MRPPGARPETEFTERCTRCLDCLPVCPDQLLVRGAGGYPELDPLRGGCSFCAECAAACRTGALVRDNTDWPWRIGLSGHCLSQAGTTCRACSEHCESAALSFRLVVGGRTLLQINPDRCNGCGACVGVCPTSALRLQPIAPQESARHVKGDP